MLRVHSGGCVRPAARHGFIAPLTGRGHLMTSIHSRVTFRRDLCAGCLSCVAACSLYRSGRHSPGSARLRLELDPFGGDAVCVVCRQCAAPACVAACPLGALRKDEATGITLLDERRCDGCRRCLEACVFGALFWDTSQGVIKCDTCGGSPACVEACKFGALIYA